jgi:ribonuclease HI
LAKEFVLKGKDALLPKEQNKKKASPKPQTTADVTKEPVKMCHMQDESIMNEIPEDKFEIVYVSGGVKKDKNGFLTGGYLIYFGQNDTRNIKESFKLPNPTNQRCELAGVIKALEAIDEQQPLVICIKSEYIYQIISHWIHYWKNNGYKTRDGNEVKNKGLIEKMWNLCSKRKLSFCLDKDFPPQPIEHQETVQDEENEE